MRASSGAVLAASLLFSASNVDAAGFNIYEMSARATSLGGAFTATADDPSAIFYNPAGLGLQQSRWSLGLSVSPLRPDARFTRAIGSTELEYPGAPESKTKSNTFFPTGLYLGHRMDERWAFGLGFFTPFGLGVQWDDPDEFAGRSISHNAQLQAFYVSPVVAFTPIEGLSLSVGGHLVKSNLDLEQINTLVLPDGSGSSTVGYNVVDIKLEGTSNWTAGFAAGALWQAHEKLRLGLNYKQGVSNDFEKDDATFTQRSTGLAQIDALVAGNLAAQGGEGTQEVSGTIEYPSIFVAGARTDLTPAFALMVDWVWFNWAVFDEITLDFESADTVVLEEHYDDAWQLRVGAEHTRGAWRTMVGYVYDRTPQPVGSVSPLLPDADRNDYSIGVSWLNASYQTEFTLGYMYVHFDERSTVENGVGGNYEGFDGSYRSNAHILSFGVTRHF